MFLDGNSRHEVAFRRIVLTRYVLLDEEHETIAGLDDRCLSALQDPRSRRVFVET